MTVKLIKESNLLNWKSTIREIVIYYTYCYEKLSSESGRGHLKPFHLTKNVFFLFYAAAGFYMTLLVTSISQLIVVAPDLTSGFTTVQDKNDIEKLSKLTILPSFASSCELIYVREEQQVSQQTILWYSREAAMWPFLHYQYVSWMF